MPTLYADHEHGYKASLADIEAAVHRLDGKRHTLMSVELPSGKTMTIGGGPDRFIAEVADDETSRWAAVDPTAGDESMDLIVGGSLVNYPARVCIGLQTVLTAVRTFVSEGGARSREVTWSVES